MPDSLPTFLKQRADRAYRALQEALQDLMPEEALQDTQRDWPDHRWGIGQNGSIAGILYHVAAWKQRTLPLLQGAASVRQEAFDRNDGPAIDDWPGIEAWFQQVGAAWSTALAEIPDEGFDRSCEFEGHPLTIAVLVAEIYEHDIQHASQIDYLRQRHRAEKARTT